MRTLRIVLSVLTASIGAACAELGPAAPDPVAQMLQADCALPVSDEVARAEIQALIDQVDALEAAGALSPGRATALRRHLLNALSALDDGRACATRAQLEAFRQQVRNFAGSGALSAADAEGLLGGVGEVLEPGLVLLDRITSEGGDRICWFSLTDGRLDAVDFVVPEGKIWTVTRVVVSGRLHSTTADELTTFESPVSIYTDANGAPGTLVYSAVLIPVEIGPIELSYTWPLPVTLQPGTYWLVLEKKVLGNTTALAWCDEVMVDGTPALGSIDGGQTWHHFRSFLSSPPWAREDLGFRLYGYQ